MKRSIPAGLMLRIVSLGLVEVKLPVLENGKTKIKDCLVDGLEICIPTDALFSPVEKDQTRAAIARTIKDKLRDYPDVISLREWLNKPGDLVAINGVIWKKDSTQILI